MEFSMPDDGSVPRFDVTHDLVAGRPMRNLGALQTSELFLLSAIRLWCGHENTPCRRALVRNGFHAVNLSCGHYAQFEELMACVTGGAGRRFTCARACYAPVMHDEAWLLECFALIQHRRPYETAELLAAQLPPAAVRVAAEALDSLAAALAGVGLHLRIRSMTAQIHPATLWRHTLSRLLH
jgi:hypothetical protein